MKAELYNDGRPSRHVAATPNGVIVTIISDNYFGYCKKEVKSQISYAANLFGLCEEEHAGGALVFPRYDLGEDFGDLHVISKYRRISFAEVSEAAAAMPASSCSPRATRIDRKLPRHRLRAGGRALRPAPASGAHLDPGRREQKLKLLPRQDLRPAVGLQGAPGAPRGSRTWRLVGTVAEGTLCHKPCTVSGGGKSEISKPDRRDHPGPGLRRRLQDATSTRRRPARRDYSRRFATPPAAAPTRARSSAPNARSARSSSCFTPDERIHGVRVQRNGSKPSRSTSRNSCFVVKRYYKPEWGDRWRDHFSVDIINGNPANELRATTASSNPATCGWASMPTAPGGPSACARTSIPRQDPDGG
jgi:hypothetical protein